MQHQLAHFLVFNLWFFITPLCDVVINLLFTMYSTASSQRGPLKKGLLFAKNAKMLQIGFPTWNITSLIDKDCCYINQDECFLDLLKNGSSHWALNEQCTIYLHPMPKHMYEIYISSHFFPSAIPVNFTL